MGAWLSIPLRLQRGRCPTDAWLTIEVSGEGVEVMEMADFSGQDVDFSPAFEWAASCTVEGVPKPPEGWHVQVCHA